MSTLPSEFPTRDLAGTAVGVLLWLGLGLMLVLTTWSVGASPGMLPVLVALPLGALTLWILTRAPLIHLAVVVSGFVLIFNYTEGIQTSEAAFGAYYVGYLGAWALRRTMAENQPILRTKGDIALGLLLAYSVFSLALGLQNGSDPLIAVNQWRITLIFGFFFPIREAILQDRRALPILLVATLVVTTYIVSRNFVRYAQAFSSAQALWEIAINRSSRPGERIAMLGFFGTLIFTLVYAQRKRAVAGGVGLVAYHLASVVLGQSRTIWAAVAAGVLVGFVLLTPRQKVRFVSLTAVGVTLALFAGALLLGDFFDLVIAQLTYRASSGGALSQDLSLVNRFYEWRAVGEQIAASPIFGHGYGVRYRFYSVIFQGTEFKLFSHNTLLTQLFRHGAVGVALLGTWVGAGVLTTFRLFRRAPARSMEKALATATLAFFPALALAAVTESILGTADGTFTLVIPLALVAGVDARARAATGERT